MLNKFLLACIGLSLILYVFIDYKIRLQALVNNDIEFEYMLLEARKEQYLREKREKDLFFNENYIIFVKKINENNQR